MAKILGLAAVMFTLLAGMFAEFGASAIGLSCIFVALGCGFAMIEALHG